MSLYRLNRICISVALMMLASCGERSGLDDSCATVDGATNCTEVPEPPLRCGAGTYQSGGECLPIQGADDGGATADAPDASASTRDSGVDARAPDLLIPCLQDTNVIVLNGDPKNFVQPGTLIVEGTAGWSLFSSASQIGITAKGSPEIEIGFASRSPSEPLSLGTYDAKTLGTPGEAWLDVRKNGLGCAQVTGHFTIYELRTVSPDAGNPVRSVTATFELACGGTGTMLRGCVHASR